MITVLAQPALITPVYSIDGYNLAIVVDSDLSALYSFRYVQEVTIDGDLITQTRVAPNVVNGLGKGVLQPNRILEDFLSYDLHNVFDFKVCENSFIQWSVRIGEESDGTLDGTGSEFEVVFGATATGYSWNGTIQYADDFTYTDFLMGATGASSNRFLTNAPSTQDINITESSFIYWLNGVASGGVTPPITSTPMALRVNVINSSGGFTTSNIYYVIPSIPLANPEMISLAVGPPDLNALADAGLVVDEDGDPVETPIISCDTLYYTIRLTDFTI